MYYKLWIGKSNNHPPFQANWREHRSRGRIFRCDPRTTKNNSTCIITPDIDKLISLAAKDEYIPTIETILEVKSIRDIENLETTNIETISARSIIPIPPFLLNTIESTIRASQGNSKAVLLETVKEIHTFNEDRDAQGNLTKRAKDSCIDLLLWLYLSSNKKI